MTASYFDAALGLIKTIGPFILLAVLAYAVMRWRSRSRQADAAGEREARRLYTDERAQRDKLPGEESGGPPARPT
jgi:hypothetical protein